MRNLAIISALLLPLCSCHNQKSDGNISHLGELHHAFSIAEPAQAAFGKGLLLLHSFEYDDAGEAFREARQADSTELMAYWGEAMSEYKALWGLQDVAAGRKVMQGLGDIKEERLGKAEDDLERDFWEGVEILYGDGELPDRNRKYADHMARLYEKYPGNQEVAAFYALALMWSVPLGDDADVFSRSARVASGILEENPNHPGALHYIIHAYDNPEYASLATAAADKYAQVAPDATHALHMPSHIYLALGRWDDMVASNEASYAASMHRMERKGLDDKARGYHSYAWLHYGYLQQGRYQNAEKLLKDMYGYLQKAPTAQARSYLISMQNEQYVETGKWNENIAPVTVNDVDLGLTAKTGQRFFKSMAAWAKGDANMIQHQVDTLEMQLATAELSVTTDGISTCSSGPTRYAPNLNDIMRCKVMVHQMKAMLSLTKNDKTEAEKQLKEAMTIESETAYSSGPPDIPFPSFEQYGKWLLAENRPEEALAQFEMSLHRAPNRANALKGKIEALEKLDREDEAGETRKVLESFWRDDAGV